MLLLTSMQVYSRPFCSVGTYTATHKLPVRAHIKSDAEIVVQDLVEEIASPKYEDCWYSNLTYEHSGFRFQVRPSSVA